MRNFLIFLVLITGLVSCKEDESLWCCPSFEEEITSFCAFSIENFSSPADNINTTIYNHCPIGPIDLYPEPYLYYNPVFNPNNSDEIAFIRNSMSGRTGYGLCTFNFCTGEFNILTDRAWCNVDWNEKDWLIFISGYHQAWKIKSNGDSLTQLSQYGFDDDPVWSPGGDLYGYRKTFQNSLFQIAYADGQTKDTIEELSTTISWAWSDDDKISFVSGAHQSNGDHFLHLSYYDMTLNDFYVVKRLNISHRGDSIIYGTDWINSTQDILWASPAGIGKVNIHTKEYTFIADGSENRSYWNLSLSPDEGKIISVRQDLSPVTEDCFMEIRRNLYIMNSDGTEERKLIFPE